MLDLAEGLDRWGCENHLIYSPRRVDESFRQRLSNFSVARTREVSMRRMPHWSDWSAQKKIADYIAQHGPFDIVHGHSTKAGGLVRLKKIARTTRIVYTPNGIFTMNPTNGRVVSRFARQVEKWLAARAAAIIAVSPEEHDHMKQIGLPSDRVHMIPNGLRRIAWPGRAAVRAQLGLSDNVLTIGFLGRLAPQKHPLLMVEAFARVRPPDDRPLRLLMVGDGPLAERARSLAAARRIADRVDWLGYRTALQTMPAFDLFVMPSRYEGMPYVLMEAVSNGIPAVATRVGGATLSIADGRNGFLVPCEDPQALASAIQRLVDDDQLRSDFSAAALKKATDFTVEKMVERTYRLYCDLCPARAPKGHSRQFDPL
jgi:glycosyltransferase involved in cell wall biosynthesis